MNEEKKYKIDFEKIKTTFKFKENGLTHSQGNQFKLLPYAANEKTLVSDFSGVVGAFSRSICDKELKSEFNFTEFIENVADEIGEFEGETSKTVFKDVIKTMFIDKENLVDFDIKTINYITSTNADDKIAKFMHSIFFDDDLKALVEKHYDREVENILYKLVLNALPELKSKEFKT
ncbi:DNA phosphorothioation-dependent restriction protein DptG, partial [Clostridium botulinum]|nr:DNA phosphorothioation-dependent restriction protein DptG [Clostridium botulinum]